ncbi:hypothetical protein ACTI_63690 [Actinoplanes sp. OR16]|uniref:hypothetical protein n=1 Tax=Actinoplanes sp. OR16 TaxID=946334 RepID=UPI000F6F26C2|nr:hypothetical protein [Actinoplanes sp. OR16]BBH69684.1 hypothetical protein ACTI_63690 [Actinoplanes sp. OR16]
MLVEVLLDTPIRVHYGFLRLGDAHADLGDPREAMRGQVNGLCGAAIPGILHLKTGPMSGDVQVRVELHTAEPVVADIWPDVVEAPFSTRAENLMLAAYDRQEGPVDLPPGNYRVRYCAGGDATLLQFWPATGADRIVKQSRDIGGYWHGVERQPALTRAELADRITGLRTRRAERLQDYAEDHLYDIWQGRVPDDPRLREAGWSAARLSQLDPDLVAALADAGDEQRRAVAAWAVERILGQAGLLGHPWAAVALAALRDGMPLPDEGGIRRSLSHDQAAGLAVEELFNAAVGINTLTDVCEAVAIAADRAPAPELVLTGVRQAFPDLVRG